MTAPTPRRIKPVRRPLTSAQNRAIDADPATWQAHFVDALRSDWPTREREVAIQWIAGGLRTGWVPDTSNLDRPNQARAGYLLDLLYLVGPTDDPPYRKAFNAALPVKAALDGPVCWRDGQCFPQGTDDLARSWGLYDGANLERIRQLIDTGLC